MKKIYLIALLLAILTGVAVYSFANSIQASTQKNVHTVVVAISRIPENTLITAEMVELKEIPVEAVNPLAARRLVDVEGKITNGVIETNEQVLSSKLNEKGSNKSDLNYNIPKGKRAYTIEVDDISGVAGYIKKGNFVDIYATLEYDLVTIDSTTGKQTANKINKTVLLLQNIEVLVTSTASLNNGKETTAYKNITLAVTPEEALKLRFTQSSGKMSVALRPVLETDTVNIGEYVP